MDSHPKRIPKKKQTKDYKHIVYLNCPDEKNIQFKDVEIIGENNNV